MGESGGDQVDDGDEVGCGFEAAGALFGVLARLPSFSVIVNHNTNPVTLTVKRSGGSEGLIRLNYATIAGSAQPGVDYVNTSGSLTWNHGNAADQQIQITILNTAGGPVDKSFSVILFPDNLWALTGFPWTTTLTIPNVDAIFRDSYE